MPYNFDYGTFNQRKFKQIFPDEETFAAEWSNTPFATYLDGGLTRNLLLDDSIYKIYALLMSRYANSTISSSSEEQFKYKVFATIFEYAPTWESRLNIQAKVRNLTITDIQQGNKTIANQALNPGTTPSPQSLEELEYINAQNTINKKRGPLDGYAYQWDLLKTDVTEDFVAKFKKLFLVFVAPDYPLYYITEKEN